MTARELVRFDASVPTASDPETVLRVLRSIPSHLEWAGRRSRMRDFKLLDVRAAETQADVGSTFSSGGASFNGTFHDASVVTECSARTFAFETTSTLDRTHGRPWHVRFSHRYEVQRAQGGTRIDYACVAHDADYVPYWLKPGVRRLTRAYAGRAIAKQMRNLAALSEEQTAPRTRRSPAAQG